MTINIKELIESNKGERTFFDGELLGAYFTVANLEKLCEEYRLKKYYGLSESDIESFMRLYEIDRHVITHIEHRIYDINFPKEQTMRLIDADALLEVLTEHFNTGRYNNHTVLGYIDAAPTVQPREGWVSVSDRLPENDKHVMAWVKDKDNKFGGYRKLVNYGAFSFYDEYGNCPDADEDGEVKRFGWHYERESEGEYDYLVFDMNSKVTHWTPVLDIPAAPKE